MKYNYTVIAKTITGKRLRIHHYELKKDAMAEVASLVGYGYQVEIMLYSIFKDAEKEGYR